MARSNEMTTPQPAPSLGDIRPSRADDPVSAEGLDKAPRLGGADAAMAPQHAPPNRLQMTAATSAAIAAHVLTLLALLAIPATEFGSGGDSVDAISVSIVPAAALESRQPSPDTAAGAATDQIAPREGESETEAKAAPDKPEETVRPPEKVEEPRVETEKEVAATPTAPEAPAPETVPDAAAAPIVTPAPPEPVAEPIPEPKVAKVDPPPEPAPPEKREEKPKEDASTPSLEASAAGGAPSRGVAPELPPAAAAATASPGEVNAYGMAVQAALLAVDQREAKARLAASRPKGTVVLRLVIAEDGTLERADIHRSSGRRQLDEVAVLLARQTAFPRPPPSLTATQRIYTAPIVFR